LEELPTVQSATNSEKHAPVNESEVCYPNYFTEQNHYEKETFSLEVVPEPPYPTLKPSDIPQIQGEDQRPHVDSDYILTEIGVHVEDLPCNEQLSGNFNEPVTFTASTCEFRLPKSPPTQNLDNYSYIPTNDNLTTLDSIASTAQASADSTNSTIVEYSQSTGSQTCKRGRKLIRSILITYQMKIFHRS
jgi:hypothetical protein